MSWSAWSSDDSDGDDWASDGSVTVVVSGSDGWLMVVDRFGYVGRAGWYQCSRWVGGGVVVFDDRDQWSDAVVGGSEAMRCNLRWWAHLWEVPLSAGGSARRSGQMWLMW